MTDASSTRPDATRPDVTLLVGCGALGTALGERLVADGGAVTAIRRDASALPAAFSTIEADLRHPLSSPLPAFDAVVITLPPGTGPEGSIYPAALTHLAAALPARPGRVLFVSSTRVFEGYGSEEFDGPDARAALTESDPTRTTGERGDALVEGEQLAVDLLGAIIVRPAGIYGPGRDSLIRRVREGAPVDHERRTNRIHEHDLVRLLEALLRAEDPPALVHAIDQEPVRLGEVVAHIAARLGVDVPPHTSPEVGGGTVLDGTRAHAMLDGLAFPTFREGYDAMLEV
ncbi:SDR family NAD(P)-dependent oxidoreductase [Microbacterium sp. 1.5R]|uniref:SDR family NAD(P)-dependent oxidoreductase n=1 Tax=Microbacterium sp. 1.5R TaxID=1916917 RepID=UPI0011AB0ACD|nr:SDR family NAD(P)-dependent oxidoreductase [Microbacterium sp. 1.5R]